ncbi:MAG: PSD1 and planctomycete cytochrome C domain-containing protein [Candidatus Hydrogenedentes bacterium]|nr:PSD1 and planctomycete cytochrome C domain-containing protein [Candidatus Hydrogenedentota bacterium]
MVCIHGLAQEYDFFEQRVRPILIDNCYECHSAESKTVKGGLLLDTREGMRKGGASGKAAVVPGAPEQSLVLEAIRYQNPDLKMPPKHQLDQAAVDAISAWIVSGAPDPREFSANAVKQSQKKLWALEPVSDPAPPVVARADWPQTPIDAFILSKLEVQSLAPAPPASKHSLIRRATIDLTGLPPTADEVDAFISDESPEAFAAVIDRLLASPAYGERWARHWLDVARYADTKGYVYGDREEARFIHSYVYRDWVIGALNADIPYDQFLLLQIAGDQIVTEANKENLAAMGFLTLGRRFLGVTHDIIDDRIDTLMRGTQALTVACARCHDHKFDPIPTEDYYSLYGVFAGSSERAVQLAGNPEPTEAFKAYTGLHDARVEEFQKQFEQKASALSTRLRAQIKEYLIAVLEADSLPTEEFYEIRQADEMNPTIVRKWQAYLLKRTPEDPIFGPWKSFAQMPPESFGESAKTYVDASFPKVEPVPVKDTSEAVPAAPLFNTRVAGLFREKPPTSMKDVAERYGELFQSVRESWRDTLEQAAIKGEPQPARLPDADEEALRQVLYAADSPVTVPSGAIVDQEWYFDEPARVELGRLQRLVDASIIEQPGSPPHAVILEDRAEQRNARVFKRGNPATRGDEAPRRYLMALSGPDRKPFEHGSGRLELARAIASAENPLTARVMVNRIWQHHFGQGLVATPSDFGSRSELPSHPELLDWLATKFVRDGWSMKKLHRVIMLSNVYQQSSESAGDIAAAESVDPENRLLWRFNRQRLDFESMRDAILAVSGNLDATMGGRGTDIVKPPYSARRTIYGYVDRQFLPAVFRVFDFPNPDMHSPQRYDTTVPQQSLFLMNSPFLMEQARGLAARTADAATVRTDDRVQAMYRVAYQRAASEDEIYKGLVFLASVPPPPPPEPVKVASTAWQYGYGPYDAETKQMKSFEPLPYFTGEAWQGGSAYPDAKLGWLKLAAEKGHPGNDMEHMVVRRWTSPISGAVSISGEVHHDTPAGNGIAARILSSKHGLLGEWPIHNSHVAVDLKDLAVAKGDTLDFVVDVAGELNSDDFRWAPVIARSTPAPAEEGANYETEWNAKEDFAGPPESRPVPLEPWEQYAQVLLLSNEFSFVD